QFLAHFEVCLRAATAIPLHPRGDSWEGDPPPTRPPFRAEAEEADEPWEPPIPLTAAALLPAFPVERYPDWLGGYAVELAEAYQVPLDLTALLGLAVGGAGLAGKFRVMIRQGWTEPTNLFVVTVLPPGERKSQVVAEIMEPVRVYEREE